MRDFFDAIAAFVSSLFGLFFRVLLLLIIALIIGALVLLCCAYGKIF